MSFEEWATVRKPEMGALITFLVMDLIFILEISTNPPYYMGQIILMSILNFVFGAGWYMFVSMAKNSKISNEVRYLLRKTKIDTETQRNLARLYSNPDKYFSDTK